MTVPRVGWRRSVRFAAAAALLVSSVASAGDDEPRLRFAWPVPTRVGVSEVRDDVVRLHYDFELRRDDAGRLRVRCLDLRTVEWNGFPAEHVLVRDVMKLADVALAALQPEVLLDADGRAAHGVDVEARLAAAVDGIETLYGKRASAKARETFETLGTDPVARAAVEALALAPWRWSVGAWVGLPLREAKVFDGPLEVASLFERVLPCPMKATIGAQRVEGAAGRWRLTLSASCDGDVAKASVARRSKPSGDVRRTVDVIAEVDEATLRPRRVDIRETLADSPGKPQTRTLTREFEWEPRPSVAVDEKATADIAATVEAWMKASRAGDRAALTALAESPERVGSDRSKAWPEGWTWTPSHVRANGEWGLALGRLGRPERWSMWPVVVHRVGGAWRVVGQGIAVAETELLLGDRDPVAVRWIEAWYTMWVCDDWMAEPGAELAADGEPHSVAIAADGGAKVVWFHLDKAADVEVRAACDDELEPQLTHVSPAGGSRPLGRAASKRDVSGTLDIGPGPVFLAVRTARPGRVTVSVTVKAAK